MRLVQFDMLESESPITYDVVYRPTSVQTSSMALSTAAVQVALVIYGLERFLYYALKLWKGVHDSQPKSSPKAGSHRSAIRKD